MHSMGCGGGGGSDSWSCTTKDAVACLQEAVWQSCTDGGAQGLTGYILNSKLPVCPEQDRAVFWDDVHPTSRAHCYIAYAWHLAIHDQTGKWPEPDVQGFKRMCAATQAWHGKDSELYVRHAMYG